MNQLRFALGIAALATVIAACGDSSDETPPQATATNLYMDVHNLGVGNVTAEAVAKAHNADLSVQARHGVQFISYWVDEQHGNVYCLSRAPNPAAVVETHREAHGLLPDTVGQVSEGH